MVNRLSIGKVKEENLVERSRLRRIGQQPKGAAQPGMNSIAATIARLIMDNQAAGGPEIEFYDDVPIDQLPSALQTVLYPVVKELLANACRHSKSKNVLVGLGQDEERLCIQVQDWGVGFDTEMVQLHRHGLKAVQQLVQWRGGTMSIDSRLGAGTCVLVEIPLLEDTTHRSD